MRQAGLGLGSRSTSPLVAATGRDAPEARSDVSQTQLRWASVMRLGPQRPGPAKRTRPEAVHRASTRSTGTATAMTSPEPPATRQRRSRNRPLGSTMTVRAGRRCPDSPRLASLGPGDSRLVPSLGYPGKKKRGRPDAPCRGRRHGLVRRARPGVSVVGTRPSRSVRAAAGMEETDSQTALPSVSGTGEPSHAGQWPADMPEKQTSSPSCANPSKAAGAGSRILRAYYVGARRMTEGLPAKTRMWGRIAPWVEAKGSPGPEKSLAPKLRRCFAWVFCAPRVHLPAECAQCAESVF